MTYLEIFQENKNKLKSILRNAFEQARNTQISGFHIPILIDENGFDKSDWLGDRSRVEEQTEIFSVYPFESSITQDDIDNPEFDEDQGYYDEIESLVDDALAKIEQKVGEMDAGKHCEELKEDFEKWYEDHV